MADEEFILARTYIITPVLDAQDGILHRRENVHVRLEPGTEYVTFAFGCVAGIPTTDLVCTYFATKEAEISDAVVNFIYDGYFSGDDVEAAYPDIFQGASGYAVLKLNVTVDPEGTSFYYNIFAGDLFRMYSKYAERKGWKLEVTNQSEGAAGGFKEIVCKISGDHVYGTMKYESGVHRVQRVPQTETQGRVHTSAASVAVLPEADEFDIELNMNDIRKDTFCSSGPGGQSVNTTYSAIRLTHIPSGIVVQCQDEKSQLKNFDKALAELRTRLYNMEYEKYLNEISAKRKTMVSTGDRSAKIRTYNYPQSRVTDHRINYTMYNLPVFMDGDIQEVIDRLQVAENAERLKAAE